MNVQDIVNFVDTKSGAGLTPDEGLQYGPSDIEVRGATICWMPTPPAIQHANEKGHNLLIGHESLFYPYDAVIKTLDVDWQNWSANLGRSRLLDEYGLTYLRLHGSLDRICIFDAFAGILKLGDPVFEDGLVKIYQIPETSFDDLVEAVKQRTGMDHVRIVPPQSGSAGIRRVGLPWGGLGLYVNIGYQQKLVEQGCDVFIAGEADNYGFRFARESGIPIIETSHEVSENPGLRQFTEMLQVQFPNTPFAFYENDRVWRMH